MCRETAGDSCWVDSNEAGLGQFHRPNDGSHLSESGRDYRQRDGDYGRVYTQ